MEIINYTLDLVRCNSLFSVLLLVRLWVIPGSTLVGVVKLLGGWVVRYSVCLSWFYWLLGSSFGVKLEMVGVGRKKNKNKKGKHKKGKHKKGKK